MKHISYSKQCIDSSDIQAVCETLQSDFLTQGPQITAFEEALKRYLNVPDVVVVSNGTAALHLSYLALDLTDTTVFTAPITFAATSNMLHAVGAKIHFVDVDPLTGLMDPKALEEALKTVSFKKACIVPISMQGNPANLPAIQALAKQYNATVVEDAAHSLGAEYSFEGKNYKSASCQHSDLATLSFHPLKTICCGEGGAVTARDPEMANRVRLLRNHGLARQPNTFKRQQLYWGFNYRMTDIQAALGVSQLKRITYFVNKRKMVAQRYFERLAQEPFCKYLTATPHVPGSSHHLFCIHFRDEKMRDFAYEFLQKNGIETQVHYMPLYHYELYKNLVGNVSLPGAEAYYRGCLSIPIYPHLSQENQDYVLEVLEKCCNHL